MFGRPRTAHLSVDDTIWLFKYLNEEEYTSAFEQPILGFFRTLHQKYGIAISFYCFEEQDWMRLSAVTDRYQQELAESSGWLRFGFHARNENVRYGEITPQQAAADYAEVTAQLRRIVGRTLDECPRIHCYSASWPVLNAMHQEGLQGVLCSETDDDCYGLTPEKKLNIRTKGSYMDKQSKLVYLATE